MRPNLTIVRSERPDPAPTSAVTRLPGTPGARLRTIGEALVAIGRGLEGRTTILNVTRSQKRLIGLIGELIGLAKEIA